MAKGDSSGIAQQGAQLDPNRFNRFGNPNMGQGNGVAGPPPGVMQMLMEMLMGQQKPGGAIGKAQGQIPNLKQGINRLRGDNRPEMNKNPPKMPVPQRQSAMPPTPQPMIGGGQFMLPQPRIQDMAGGMGGGMGMGMSPGIGAQIPGGAPQMMPPQQANMGMGAQLQNPDVLRALMMGGGRNFV